MSGRNITAELVNLIERHTLAEVSTDALKAELSRRGEALPQQTDLRGPLADLRAKAEMLNESLQSGDYDDKLREEMERSMHAAEHALIVDSGDAMRRQHRR